MKRFLASTDGALALGAAIVAVPVVGFAVAAVQVTVYSGVETRLHQSQCSAAVAIAKEGDKASTQARQELLNGWMPANLEALGRSEDTVLNSYVDFETGGQLNSFYQAKPLVVGLMNGLFEKPLVDDQPVTTERFYKPLEVVVVVDGSSSTRAYVENYKTSMKNIARTFLRNRDVADDVRVSLIAFSGHMNVGVRYADKLVIPNSRKLYDDGTVAYDQRKASLDAVNPLLVGDLLAAGGPGSAMGMACVGRKFLANTATPAAIQDYVEDVLVPPDRPEDGFTLLIGDERPHTEANTSYVSYGQPYQLVNTFLQNNPTKVGGQYSFLDYMVVPPSAVAGDPYSLATAKLWGDGWSVNSTLNKSSVGIYYNCSSMPMLIGSNDLAEIEERVDLYSAGWTTGGDEGLAWALRALSPEWSEIWDVGEDFPAPYHSTTEKVIFFLGDTYNNSGYPTGITGTGPDVITGILQSIVDSGVHLYMFVDGSMWNSSMNKFYSIVSGILPPENIYYAGTSGASVVNSLQKMEEMAVRTYDVRLSTGI
jgi:hypothetical protein